MELHGKPADPYRIFFPLGIVLGAMGVSIWPLYYFGITEGYSGRAHAFVQTDGFLYSFIAGFLLTAIPRFTATEPPSRRVQCVLAAIVAGSAIAFEFQQFAIGQTAFVISHAFLITLAARRFRRRRLDPPDTFVLAGLGLICGALGALINAGIALNFIPPLWDPLGKRALTEGMVLLLVLGIGGFLGPRLLGFAQLPQFVQVPDSPGPRGSKPLFYKAAGLALILSLIGEYGFGFSALAFVRSAAASAVILSTVQPWRHCFGSAESYFGDSISSASSAAEFPFPKCSKNDRRYDENVKKRTDHTAENRRGQRLHDFRAGMSRPHDWEQTCDNGSHRHYFRAQPKKGSFHHGLMQLIDC